MMSSKLALVICVSVLGTVIGYGAKTVVGPVSSEPSKSECVRKAEACPAPKACPALLVCPPQSTLEIRKPLSEELDAVAAACKPEIDRTLGELAAATEIAYGELREAQAQGVSASDLGWVENEVARKAASAAYAAEEASERAIGAAFDVQMKCRRDMEHLFHATDAWAWIDGEEVDEAMAESRGFADDFYEAFGYYFSGVRCNMVARHLECPLDSMSTE